MQRRQVCRLVLHRSDGEDGRVDRRKMLCDIVAAVDVVGRKDDETAFVGFGCEEEGVSMLVALVDVPRPASTGANAMESTMTG
jgi:hypothetical protein